MANDNWREEALARRSRMLDAISEAHVDAGRAANSYGWIKVDCHGNLTRVDPDTITEKKKGK